MDDSNLTSQKCVPCEIGSKPMEPSEAQKLHSSIPSWQLELDHLQREFKFKDFKEAMTFVNQVADIAEQNGHHPDIYIWYNKVKLTLTTHASNGLSLNDFIMAAKIDQLSS